MSHIRMGFKHTLGEKSYLTEYINWHDAMVLSEPSKFKTHDMEYFKEITEYVNCAAADNMPEWFWSTFEKFNYEDKKAYLNFVSGRSRTRYVLGELSADNDDVKHKYFKSHKITVDASKAEGAEINSKPEEFELILAPSYESQEAFKDALMAALTKARISSRTI